MKNGNFNLFKTGKKIKLASYLKSHLLKIEFFLIILSIIAYFTENRIIVSISLLILSILYFLLYFAKYNLNPKTKIFISDFLLLINCLGRSSAIAGIYQTISEGFTQEIALLIGIVFLFLSVPFYIYFFIVNRKDEIISITEFLRNLFILILTTIFVSRDGWI